MTLRSHLSEQISARGRIGRVAFIQAETYRGLLLGLCYGLFLLDQRWLCALLLPVAIWIGVVGTIKRFNDLALAPPFILVALTVIAAGFGLAWQTGLPWLALSGLGPYLLWICLTPGRAPRREDTVA